ncbi:MAG: hypothetical protein RL670_729 [Actinomycetota bacterium]
MTNSPGIAYLLLFLAIWVLGGLLVGAAAARKNRSRQSFFWLTLLLSPILTGLIVATLPFDESDPRHPRNKALAKSGL